MSEQPKSHPCTEPSSELPKLFAVLCPDSRDYFLVTEEEAFRPKLRSKITGKEIPEEDHFVQYMSTEGMITWDASSIERIVQAVVDAESELSKESIPIETIPGAIIPVDSRIVLNNLDEHIIDVRKTIVQFPEEAKEIGCDAQALATDAVSYADLEYRTRFLEGYYANHTVSLDFFQNQLLVFQVGSGGGIIYNIPLAAASADVTDKIQTGGLAAALFLELIILIGRLLGVKGNAKKAGDAIEKALENSKVMKAFLDFVNRVSSGAGDLAKATATLIKVIYREGELGAVFSAFLAGAFTIFGIIWLIGKLLSKLVPGLGWAVTAAELLVWVAGVLTKIKKLRQ